MDIATDALGPVAKVTADGIGKAFGRFAPRFLRPSMDDDFDGRDAWQFASPADNEIFRALGQVTRRQRKGVEGVEQVRERVETEFY
jgi:hypothetical protein